jgi:signal transduction histidine kinase
VRFALRNLLTNANKFTTQGSITISYERSNGKDFIHVADTGVGMGEEQTAKLNRNKQTDYANGTNNETGHGLGLGLLHDYLAQHDGQLSFQSEIGVGTKASFTL